MLEPKHTAHPSLEATALALTCANRKPRLTTGGGFLCRAFFLSFAPEEEQLDLRANLEENTEVMEAHLCQIEG